MKALFVVGAVNGFLAVALGAFGAHGLEGRISEQALKTWEKAVHYQMFHTVSIFVVGLLLMRTELTSLLWSGWLFVIGILLFSGSLYLYSASGIRWLAMITPFGGILFLCGWILLGYALVRFV